MSYSGPDDQSEDGELKRSPAIIGHNQEEIDFSLSDDADTADSLDIKPPQAKLANRSLNRNKYSERNDGHGHHSRSERHRDSERIHSHRDSEKRHRDKHESSRSSREYRDKEREYRDKEMYYSLKEQYSREGKERYVSRDRREEIRYTLETTRDVRYSDSKIPYTEHEKHRKEREIKYIEYEQNELRRDKREAKYYESFDQSIDSRRERKEIPTLRHETTSKDLTSDLEIDYSDKAAADRELADLRERLLDKRRTKENEKYGKHSKSSRRHKSRRDAIGEPGEIMEDSKTYVKEIIDLSKADETKYRDPNRHVKHSHDRGSDLDEMTAKEIEERELRREKLLEAEREMARQKKLYRQEIEVRRERRERKRLHEQQKEEAKRQRLENEQKTKRAAALTDELTGVVTVSDNSDESEIEIADNLDSDHKEHSDNQSGSDASDSDNSSVSHQHHSDRDSIASDEIRKHGRDSSPMSVDDGAKSDRSDSRSRSRTKSRSRERDRNRDRTISRSRSRSKSPEEDDDDDDDEEVDKKSNEELSKNIENNDNAPTEENKTETEPVEELPPYIPAIQGCRSVEEFQCLNRIEEGTYGVVYRARDKRTDEIVALKRLKMEKEKEGFPITSLREINTLLKGQHPNIVTVREIVVGSNMDKIFIVMDYVEHDLKSLMETMRNKKQVFVPGEVKCLLKQLLKAVAHLHDNWILHRDLKTSNLLLSHKGILKVGDFGLAREYGSPLKPYTPIVVTLWYRAPELLLCTKEYSTPIDIWSVGCIFAELLLMNALFPGKSEIDQLNRIFKDLGTPNESIWPGYSKLPAVQKMTFTEYPVSQLRTKFHMLSETGLKLLTKFLTYNPEKRITAEDALTDPYFTEIPLPIDPAMFPTWPAKSELGHRKAMAASPKPPSGGGQYKKLGDGDDDSALGFHMGTSAVTHPQNRRIAALGGGFSLKF